MGAALMPLDVRTLEVYSLGYGLRLTVVSVGTQTRRPMMFTQTKTYEKR